MIGQSIKLASKAYVFEPNNTDTWAVVKSIIENFLFSLWKQGALVGSKPEDAYQVLIGLGSTQVKSKMPNGRYLSLGIPGLTANQA